MNYSTLKNDMLETFANMFPNVKTQIVPTDFGGKITSFFLEFQDQDSVKSHWENIVSAIAFYFQTGLDSDFEKWNLYTFFLVPSPVSKDLKYRIENDPVSSRKIVVDHYAGETPDQIIQDHITNSDLKLTPADLGANASLSRSAIISEELERLAATRSIKKLKGKEPFIIEALLAIEQRTKS